MGFPGIWMTESGTMAYRVIPKCACSTIGQIMYFSDNGEFFDGDIHDAQSRIHKWGIEASKPVIERRVLHEGIFTFTCVRNPWTRILSSFFDKIAGVQRSGTRYRENLIPALVRKYGVDVEGDFDQIRAFRRFLLFARDTVRYGKPMDPDLHWSPMSSHAATLRANGGHYDFIFATEDFNAGMRAVLDRAKPRHDLDLETLPRFNESEGHGPRRAFPVEDYFDDMSVFLMNEIYRRDFNLFRYGREPYSGPPKRAFDLDEINARLVSKNRD
jgi:Sulfotransferase family